jgi:RND family efflux transporter MFP subunit
MNSNRLITLAVAAAIVTGIGFWYARTGVPPDTRAEDSGPVALVKTAVLQHSRIEETLKAYGTVVAAPGEARTFSVPFECRVRKVLVAGGQILQPDTPLIEIEPSPETLLQFNQARNERDSATAQLKLLEQRLKLKLATRQDLLQAQLRVHDAELKVKSMEQRGVDGSRIIRADASGLVSRIAVQAGQIVPAGSVLLETIGANQITVRLGVESEDVGRLQPGQTVRLIPVDMPDTDAMEGHIRLITREVKADTRLVDVFVAPPENARLLLNEYMEGQIVIAAQDALVAPRAAVLPESDHYVLYTIEQHHAVKHSVRVGLQNSGEIQVIGTDLQAGQTVVTTGNSELQNGMAVQELAAE